jgi:phosphonate transport system ATP-binding protein
MTLPSQTRPARLALAALSARHGAARAGAAPALHEVTLQVGAGEQLALIGPSGAGKTTLLHVAAAALAPSQGQSLHDGQDPWRLAPAALKALRGALFLAPQVPPLPPRQRVVTAVLAGRLPQWGLWTSLKSLFYPIDIAAAHEALARFDLAEKLFERVDRLSGGERQRVGLARALLSPATLWLMDEPLAALDPTRARLALQTLVALAAERGVTLVTTMHQVDMALAHFPRIVGLREGRVQFDLPAAAVSREHLAALYAQHEDEWLAPPRAALDEGAPTPTAPVREAIAARCR